MEELQRGYMLGDRLLRPAMVKVANVVSKRDYYEVLGRRARPRPIRRSRARTASWRCKYHPDRNPGDKAAEEQFKEAAEAYAVLADTDKRHMYDRFGHAGLGGAATGGFDPNVFTGFEDILGGLGDIFGFGDIFGGGAPPRRPAARRRSALRPRDLVRRIGQGRRDGASRFRGRKRARRAAATARPQARSRPPARSATAAASCATSRASSPSPARAGSAAAPAPIIAKPCPTCKGAGRVQKERKLTVRIPAGIATGQRLRLTGEGEAGPAGRPSGRPLRRHPRAGARVLPARRQRPVLRDPAELPDAGARRRDHACRRSRATSRCTVPDGTQTGTTFRLRGKGMPDVGGRGRGDLLRHGEGVDARRSSRRSSGSCSSSWPPRCRKEQFEPTPVEHDEDDKGLFDRVKDIFG